jgi:hypothetical protein
MKPLPALPRLLLLAAFTASAPFGTASGSDDPSLGPGGSKDFPGIEKLMSAEEFERAGLGQLSAGQLSALNGWLVRYTAGEAYVVQATSEEVRAAAPEFRLEARIVPPFEGWSGQTLFRLDNGQTWRQRIKGRYRFDGDDTRVVITRNLLGFYNMKIVSTGRSIGVEPIRRPDGDRESQ